MNMEKFVLWIQKKSAKYWNHEYEKIGIKDAEKLVSWTHKNWSHGYGKIGVIDTKKMIS